MPWQQWFLVGYFFMRIGAKVNRAARSTDSGSSLEVIVPVIYSAFLIYCAVSL